MKRVLSVIIGLVLLLSFGATVSAANTGQDGFLLNPDGTTTRMGTAAVVTNPTACPVSESTMLRDFQAEVLRLQKRYDFASIELAPGFEGVTLRNDLGAKFTLPAEKDPSKVGQKDNYDCVLTEQKVWFELANNAGVPWKPTGVLPYILTDFNGYTINAAKDFVHGGFGISGTVQNPLFLDFSIGNSDFLVTVVKSNPMTMQILTVNNQFNPKDQLSPMELVEYYAFNQNSAIQSLQLKVGQVPGYGTALLTQTGIACGVDNPLLKCAPEFYYNLSPAEVDHIYQTLYARRSIKGKELPVGINTTFQFVLQRYEERKIVTATIRGKDLNGNTSWLQVDLIDKNAALAQPDVAMEVIKFLSPNCENIENFFTGTCGTDIVYCQDGKCGFQTGLEEVRSGLQDSNVSTTNSLKDLIRGWINFALSFLFLVAVVVIIVSGIYMVANFGNDDFISKGKKMITYAIIGLLLIVLAYPIINTLINAVQ